MQAVAGLQTEFVTFMGLAQEEFADYVLPIEAVQVKVCYAIKNKADDDMFGADERTLAVHLVSHFECMDPHRRAAGPV